MQQEEYYIHLLCGKARFTGSQLDGGVDVHSGKVYILVMQHLLFHLVGIWITSLG